MAKLKDFQAVIDAWLELDGRLSLEQNAAQLRGHTRRTQKFADLRAQNDRMKAVIAKMSSSDKAALTPAPAEPPSKPSRDKYRSERTSNLINVISKIKDQTDELSDGIKDVPSPDSTVCYEVALERLKVLHRMSMKTNKLKAELLAVDNNTTSAAVEELRSQTTEQLDMISENVKRLHDAWEERRVQSGYSTGAVFIDRFLLVTET